MLAAQIINTGEPVVIESAIQSTAPDPQVSVRHMFEQGANSIILSPIFRDEKIVGVLSAISDRAKHFSAEAVKSIDIVCDALGRALEQVDKDAPFVSSYTDTTIHQAILQVDELINTQGTAAGIFPRFDELVSGIIPYDRMAILYILNQLVNQIESQKSRPPRTLPTPRATRFLRS